MAAVMTLVMIVEISESGLWFPQTVQKPSDFTFRYWQNRIQ